MVVRVNIVKPVNNPYFTCLFKSHYLPRPHVFSSMPLQSGIVTNNRNIIIGLVSSIITAALGYGIRLILYNYIEYDVFTNLDNWIVSLSYFCSLGGIRFVINECLKENTYQMSYCGGPMAVSNNTAASGSLPVGSNAAGYNSSMQAPNNSGIGSSSAGPSSIPATADHSTTGIGSSSAADASITNDRSKIEQRIGKVQEKIDYFHYQLQAARRDVNEVMSRQLVETANGNYALWHRDHVETMYALRDCETNLSSEARMHHILTTKLRNGDYSMSDTSAISDATKRRFSGTSMANDYYDTPITKRGPGD